VIPAAVPRQRAFQVQLESSVECAWTKRVDQARPRPHDKVAVAGCVPLNDRLDSGSSSIVVDRPNGGRGMTLPGFTALVRWRHVSVAHRAEDLWGLRALIGGTYPDAGTSIDGVSSGAEFAYPGFAWVARSLFTVAN
jgi:hypothetical protein